MTGKSSDQVRAELERQGLTPTEAAALAPHRTFDGNRPSSVLLCERMDPRAVGALVALYEHKVFVQGAIFGVNSFDQWGVELGKQLASSIEAELEHGPGPDHDASTTGLINAIRKLRSD